MRHLCTCWHKLLKSIISLLDRISPLLLSSRVSLPSPLPVRLALLWVAVAVVVRARLGLIIVVDSCWYLFFSQPDHSCWYLLIFDAHSCWYLCPLSPLGSKVGYQRSPWRLTWAPVAPLKSPASAILRRVESQCQQLLMLCKGHHH